MSFEVIDGFTPSVIVLNIFAAALNVPSAIDVVST